MEQRTIEWYKARLGKITSSNVYKVMTESRTKSEVFGDTAKTYLYELAADRNLDEETLNDELMLMEYLGQGFESEAMRRGTELEASARVAYEMGLPSSLSVAEVGFVPDDECGDFYGDSPDGLVLEYGVPVGCLEIKCPKTSTWIRYREAFASGKTLRQVEPKYYWQCQSHMRCNAVPWCDFVYFDPYMEDGIQVVRIERNEEDITRMVERIKMANGFINDILNQIKQ